MKIKLFLVTLALTALLYFTADCLFVSYSRDNLIESATNAVSQSISVYHYIDEADKFTKIRQVESLAKKKELLEAFDPDKWNLVSEEILAAFKQEALERLGKKADNKMSLSPEAKAFLDRIEAELNVVNQLYDDNVAIFVVDSGGNIVAKNLDGVFRGINLSKEKLIETVFRGRSNRDVIKIEGKTYLVSAAPMVKNNAIIGAYCSANYLDSEAAKEAVARIYDESIFKSSKFYFGFFDKDSLLGSTLPTKLHESFKRFIAENQDLIEKIGEEGSKRHDLDVVLNNETFFASIARHPSLSEDNDMFYITLVSKDKLLKPLSAKFGTFSMISLFILLFALVLLFIIDEQNNKPINKFMEGMLEIINGNVRFRFNNDAEGVEANLNQNANMMIATILGEKIPDKKLEPPQENLK